MKAGHKILVLTNYTCNNNCIFCSANANSNFNISRSTQEISQIITENSRTSDSIEFIGGEFTIRKDAIDLIRFSSESGYREISIETNGRMFSSPVFTDRITGAGLNRITFSIHGVKPETHDFLTRVDGSFKQSVEGLINVSKKNVRLCINFVINRYNYTEIPSFAEEFSTYENVEVIIFSYIKPQDFYTDNLMVQYSSLLPYLNKIRDTRILQKVRYQYIPLCLIGEKNYQSQQHKNNVVKDFIFTDDSNLYDSLTKEFTRPEKCGICIFSDKCLGIPVEYNRIYGSSELLPLKKNKENADDRCYE